MDEALAAVADFGDLQSPYTLGHSKVVARLAGDAGRAFALDDETVSLLRRAALLRDLGRLGVSNAIWDKQGSFGAGEWERSVSTPI